jgi:hypothetical protein
MDKQVINLSKLVLTQDQINVLSQGLNFCPTPNPPNPGDLRFDLDSLHRRLRLRSRFHISDEDLCDFDFDDNPHPTDPFRNRKFRINSTFNPVGPLALEAFILNNEHDYNNRPLFKPNRLKNLTTGEIKAIKQLKQLDDQIVLKKADKGSAVVVMDRDMYIKEAYTQLENPSFYLHLENDLTYQYNKEVLNFIDKMYENGEIDISVVNYMNEVECRTANFYLLPKIHKGIYPPPGRPIVSANGCPTEKISKLVDHFLNPASTSHKSYVKDTAHFQIGRAHV